MKKRLKERLQVEYDEILDLESRVSYDENGKPMIEIKPIEVVTGFPPDKYVVTYRCKSIIDVKEQMRPIFGYEHQIEIHLRQDFLEKGASLSARTPFWHPNIDHKEPYHICVDLPNFVDPTTAIWQVILRVGELIQYKKYHAVWVSPYPQDQDAAKWVLEYAEPNGILGKNKPIDDRNLLSEVIDVWSNGNAAIENEEFDLIIWGTKKIEPDQNNNKRDAEITRAFDNDLSEGEIDIFIGGIKEIY